MSPAKKPTGGSSDRPHHRPPKDPESSDLWVGNILAGTSHSDVMAIFSPFSALDASIAPSHRTYAFVHFKSPAAAAKAMTALAGSALRGRPMQIEFARPPKLSKCLWIGGIGPDATEKTIKDKFSKFGNIEDFSLICDRNSAFLEFQTSKEASAAKKEMDGKRVSGKEIRIEFQRPFQWPESYKRIRDGPPSNTLWVGYPDSVRIEQEMLHNAMILFGEIERISSFPERHYCFVEFRSVDEARRAKEGLQGRLFGDPRIHIMFSRSPPGKDTAPLLPGFSGMRSETMFDPMGHLLPPLMPGMSGLMRPYLPQGFDLDLGGPNWRRPSPGPGITPSSSGIRPTRPIWDDGFDTRGSKRSRIHHSPADDEPFHGRMLDDEPAHHVPGQMRGSPDIDHVWRGIIAKGGAHICHARCVPIGKGLDFPLPEVVNCSARTDLDLLTKHYAEAIGFDIVFFLPDSEDDFPSYTEFLRYLGLNGRAGVAKFDDGATMFLVPPSDFLHEVLKVSGPERLYGVVLKLRQQSATVAQQRPQAAALPLPHYERGGSISQDDYGYIPPKEDPDLRDLRMEYRSNVHENSISLSGDREPHADVPPSESSAPDDDRRNPEATSQVGLSLTPELIAILASLIPSNNQSSAAGNVQMPSSSTARSSSFPDTPVTNSLMLAQGWSQSHQGSYSGAQLETTNTASQQPQQLRHFGTQQQEQLRHFGTQQQEQLRHFGTLQQEQQQQLQEYSHQYSNQPPHMPQYPTYDSFTNGPDISGESFPGSAHGQGVGSNMPRASYEFYSTHERSHEPDAGVALNQQAQYQPDPPSSFAEGHANRVLQTQMGLASPSDIANYSAQSQRPQIAVNNYGEGPSQESDDKNHRYQSTLQFAASLLQKIQQEQRGSSHGSGN